ncbi:kinase-like domain-containing protein [Gigaspora rosea]|uniref:Kinase-like domain-containing protein n=1 Tax=Gigaspora rosea TaxID=44941 RepID=A0A397VLX3_9GLOM|nr:kinase-like domain-containing protein [Gigaspora rosea]
MSKFHFVNDNKIFYSKLEISIVVALNYYYIYYFLILRFEKEFCNWTSDNHNIDQLIQQTQLNAFTFKDIIEWILFSKFTNIKYLAKEGFGTIFKAVWIDGYITGIDYQKNVWKRSAQIDICLKGLYNSKDIKQEFLEEIKNQHKYGGKSAIVIYGITKNPKDGNYMIVMEYAKQGSLRQLLDSKYVNQNMFSSYITDFGLCKPVSQDSSSKAFFGVLPYIAPEVLYAHGKEYTQKSDIYSFGIIMSEVFTGYPPYHDIPHDKDLAIRICLGYRPKIRCEVPQLLLDLINKCLDADPQNRPTASELADTLNKFFINLKNKETGLYSQVEDLDKNFLSCDQVKSTRFEYQTHPQAIYTSQFLNLSTLPKPASQPSQHINFEVPDSK